MSLNALIIISFVLYILTVVNTGFSVYVLFPLAATVMFAVKKVKIYIKFNNIILCEALPLFFSVVLNVLFKQFSLIEFIITLILRCIFIGIVVYDAKVYTYFTEEREVKK